jgi:hypothetical protein
MKFVPHGIGKDRQTVTYQTVKDYIIQLVQKAFRNGKDVADSLRKMEKIDMTKNERTCQQGRYQERQGLLKPRSKKDSICCTKQKSTSIPRGNMSLRTT